MCSRASPLLHRHTLVVPLPPSADLQTPLSLSLPHTMPPFALSHPCPAGGAAPFSFHHHHHHVYADPPAPFLLLLPCPAGGAQPRQGGGEHPVLHHSIADVTPPSPFFHKQHPPSLPVSHPCDLPCPAGGAARQGGGEHPLLHGCCLAGPLPGGAAAVGAGAGHGHPHPRPGHGGEGGGPEGGERGLTRNGGGGGWGGGEKRGLTICRMEVRRQQGDRGVDRLGSW